MLYSQLAALAPPKSHVGHKSPTLAPAPTRSARTTGCAPTPPASEVAVVEIVFRVHDEHAPALRSAVEELAGEVAGRLEGMHGFAAEQALTDAAVAVQSLRRAVFAKVPAGNPHYKPRRR